MPDSLITKFVGAAHSLALTIHKRGTEAQKERVRKLLREALAILDNGTTSKSPPGS